jgi:hypothetical protein
MTEIKASESKEMAILSPEGVVEDAKRWATEAGSLMAWTWLVIYRNEDGPSSLYSEYGDDYGIHAWSTVDLKRVQLLALVPLREGLPSHEIAFNADDRRTPVFFRRVTIAAEGYIDPRALARTLHCIGWMRDYDANYQFYFEDGSSISTSDLQGV